MKTNSLIPTLLVIGSFAVLGGCTVEDRGPDVVTTPSPPVVVERSSPDVIVTPPAGTTTTTTGN